MDIHFLCDETALHLQPVLGPGVLGLVNDPPHTRRLDTRALTQVGSAPFPPCGPRNGCLRTDDLLRLNEG